ncbi:MAG: hypothetical protein ACSHYB_01885 [Roseibacillus sp.]
MNKNISEVLKQVSGWILPGLGLLNLVGVVLGGGVLSLFAVMGLLVGGSGAFFGFSFLLGFVVTMLGFVLTAHRFFQLQKENELVKAKID